MIKLDYLNPLVLELFTYGEQTGMITFDQLIASVPDRYVEPDKADEMLVRMRALGIDMVSAMGLPLSQRPYDKEQLGLRVEALAAERAAEQVSQVDAALLFAGGDLNLLDAITLF